MYYDEWDDDFWWWYEKEWAVYDDWGYFVGYCYGEYDARYLERLGYELHHPMRF